MQPLRVQEMILAAHKQQKLTGRKDADVALVIPGKWPDNDKKRLAGKAGPLGQCMAEYANCVLCLFKADEVIRYCSKFLPKLTIKAKE